VNATARLERAGLLHPTGPLRSFPTINAAVRGFRQGGSDPAGR
jgi:hypothetical protein